MGLITFVLSLLEVILGLILPAYASLSLITGGRKPSSDEYTRWGAYWIIYIILEKIVFCQSMLSSKLFTRNNWPY